MDVHDKTGNVLGHNEVFYFVFFRCHPQSHFTFSPPLIRICIIIAHFLQTNLRDIMDLMTPKCRKGGTEGDRRE